MSNHFSAEFQRTADLLKQAMDSAVKTSWRSESEKVFNEHARVNEFQTAIEVMDELMNDFLNAAEAEEEMAHPPLMHWRDK